MSKKEFWIRFPIYLLFYLILPAGYLLFRFNLFKKITTYSIGGWGLIFIFFGTISLIRLIRAVRKGLPFSYMSVVLTGLCKSIIPLAGITVGLYLMRNAMPQMIEFMVVLTSCQFLALLINPIPRWAYENHLGEEGYKLKTVLQSAGLIKKEENKQ